MVAHACFDNKQDDTQKGCFPCYITLITHMRDRLFSFSDNQFRAKSLGVLWVFQCVALGRRFSTFLVMAEIDIGPR